MDSILPLLSPRLDKGVPIFQNWRVPKTHELKPIGGKKGQRMPTQRGVYFSKIGQKFSALCITVISKVKVTVKRNEKLLNHVKVTERNTEN
jgi:hypothetical protein